MRKNYAIPRRFLPQKNAKNSKRRAYDVSSLHGNPALQSDKAPQFREDSKTDDGRIINAKSQRSEGAKSFFLLGVSAVLFRRIAHFWQNVSSARSAPLRDALDKGIWLRLCV